jgi:hypothetical protein
MSFSEKSDDEIEGWKRRNEQRRRAENERNTKVVRFMVFEFM